MVRSFVVLFLFSSLTISHAQGFWYDEKMGLDWELMAGRYTGFQAVSTCGGFSSAHHRVPEIEELREAYRNGILDPELNPYFAKKIQEQKIYFSKNTEKTEKFISRTLFNFEKGTTFLQADKSNIFLGLLCVTEPGIRLFWYDEGQDIYWKRMSGRTTLYVAQNECKGYLNNSWLPTIEELEKAFHQGLASEKNEVFGYALQHYQLLLSNTPETPEQSYWALDMTTGQRQAVPVGFEDRYFFLCAHIFD